MHYRWCQDQLNDILLDQRNDIEDMAYESFEEQGLRSRSRRRVGFPGYQYVCL